LEEYERLKALDSLRHQGVKHPHKESLNTITKKIYEINEINKEINKKINPSEKLKLELNTHVLRHLREEYAKSKDPNFKIDITPENKDAALEFYKNLENNNFIINYMDDPVKKLNETDSHLNTLKLLKAINLLQNTNLNDYDNYIIQLENHKFKLNEEIIKQKQRQQELDSQGRVEVAYGGGYRKKHKNNNKSKQNNKSKKNNKSKINKKSKKTINIK